MSDVTIRFACADDAREISEIYGYYVENSAVTFEYDAPDEEEIKRRIEAVSQSYPFLCAVHDGEVVGFAYAAPLRARPAYDLSAESTIYICNDMRGKGIGEKIYKKLNEILKEQGVTNVYACVATCCRADEHLTKASPMFHNHLGYKAVGSFRKCGKKFDKWYDVTWMEKILTNHGEIPGRFIPVNEIKDKITF